MRISTALTIFAGLAIAPAGEARAQQFTVLPDAFPGPTYWTEGVTLGDVDNDGDLDVFFARGEGWDHPGHKQQNGLFVNATADGKPTFTDESEKRLGISESHARDVRCADVDGDGWLDALFCNGFNTAPPFLFVNRGEKKPGYFRMESDARGLTETLSSASADFGDVDDDGDLDLVIADTGPRWADLPGGRPRLYLNDGKGVFAEAPAQLALPIKTTHMGVHLVDLDGDFDLDFFGPNKTEDRGLGHYLARNDGAGKFEDASDLLPATTGAVYESDAADLDGDGDVDLAFVSLDTTDTPDTRFPFGEGPVKNLLAESGALKFEKGVAQGADDDNEIGFVDYDGDGRLDLFVASLGPSEKVQHNEGGMRFAMVDGVVQPVKDPTLDFAIGDLDGDGDADLVTAQGLERIGAKQPPCQAFLNQGKRDARPPAVLREQTLATPRRGGPWVVHLEAQDSAVDNGECWLKARVRYSLEVGGAAGAEQAGTAMRSGGLLYRFAMKDTADGKATRLTYVLELEDASGNVTTVGPRTVDLPHP